MLSLGAHDKHFYFLGPDTSCWTLVEVEMIRKLVRSDSAPNWDGGITERWELPDEPTVIPDAVEILGDIVVYLRKPQLVVDFATHYKMKDGLITKTIPAGETVFSLVKIQLPAKAWGEKFGEFALLPGSTLGLSWVGLLGSQKDYSGYWKNWHAKQLLGILQAELERKKTIIKAVCDPKFVARLVA